MNYFEINFPFLKGQILIGHVKASKVIWYKIELKNELSKINFFILCIQIFTKKK